MARTHNLGFPRIGAHRELKSALEGYWRDQHDADALQSMAARLRATHWRHQAELGQVPVGDFSLYDHVLDTSAMVGNLPPRVTATGGAALDQYFRAARGRSGGDDEHTAVAPGEMTKWFNTNYHYTVPEFSADTRFSLDAARLIDELHEAGEVGVSARPVILGPVTYLWLGKSVDHSDRLALLDRLLPVYVELLEALAEAGAEWVQIDEPALVTDLDPTWRAAFQSAYDALFKRRVKLLLTTYFGPLREHLELVAALPVDGLHIDAVSASEEIDAAVSVTGPERVLSLGVISGRNVWRADLDTLLEQLEPIHEQLGDRLWLAPSCSLLHVPMDTERETSMDPEIRRWLAFARQKLNEIEVLATALNDGREVVAEALADSREAVAARRASPRVINPTVRDAVASITAEMGARHHDYHERTAVQRKALDLPVLPTTTIGSFPQTRDIRQARQRYRRGEVDAAAYQAAMRGEIETVVKAQERIGLDVLVHGEPERNDMVEYFGEQLEGYAFTEYGWVQSYGSRCVKPPILYGDVQRPEAMTVGWIRYAQSLTDRPVKGMLTGPVTILNWSFVRDDQPRSESCRQLALAMRDEVLDLEAAGVGIIQIDEAALREGLPLRRADWQGYLDWAIDSFRITANGVADATQIHTHMCYSEFNDIIEQIARMDADVITIESSRSDMVLLDAFRHFEYPNDIGPGVYDIHSPNVPSTEAITGLLRLGIKRIPVERLWVNPDCGLKTRGWAEVTPALEAMVAAARALRRELAA